MSERPDGGDESDGFFHDFDVSITFMRPDGKPEYKDPNWIYETGFKCLAPAVFGSEIAWRNMTQDQRAKCSKMALLHFNQVNGFSWDSWYPDHLERKRRRRCR